MAGNLDNIRNGRQRVDRFDIKDEALEHRTHGKTTDGRFDYNQVLSVPDASNRPVLCIIRLEIDMTSQWIPAPRNCQTLSNKASKR